LIPGLALRFPIKKWAAVAALLGGLAYLCIADFPVSAQRAYVMVALVLLAVIIDRQVLPMRSLALAAIVVLLVAPASLLGPSFQLSFAATMAIVALYEAWRRWRQSRPNPAPRYYGWLRRINLYVGGVLATTFVASLITTPYAIYHFNQFVQYHLLANMAASPVFSFIVMPSAVFAMLLLPLGWAHPFLWLMGQGIEWTLAIATAISNLPHAMLHVPTPPGWALAAFSFGVCWLCFWQNRIRHLGWLMILLSIVPFFAMRQPDILIGEKAEQIAIRLDDGGYAMWQGSVKNFKAGLWKEALDVEQFAPHSALKEISHCDAAGCILDYHSQQIALPKWREAAAEDCADTAIVITDFYTDCPGAVDRPQQAVSLWVNDSGITRREADPFSERLSVPQAAASSPARP